MSATKPEDLRLRPRARPEPGARRPAERGPARHAGPGVVICYRHEDQGRPGSHDVVTQAWAARALARLQGCEYGGEFDASQRYPAGVYFVPKATLCPIELAHGLGIRGEQDLFGGVVPFPFVATKVITHVLPEADSPAPVGWSREFGRRVQGVVLPGASAFSLRDARLAGERMLRLGPVRSKDPQGIGGAGQTVITERDQLEAHLRSLDEAALARDGIVFEHNLEELSTLSVGQIRVGAMLASYFGTQRLTANNHGGEAYGGSRLTVVRGDFDALLAFARRPETRLAVEQARVYHQAALESFPGMFASRCNYDIAQGADCHGQWVSGVLEQSWRLGGASGAELLALQAFRDEPALELVCASTTEVYGRDPEVPDGATICYSGTDERAGPLTKFAMLEPYADP